MRAAYTRDGERHCSICRAEITEGDGLTFGLADGRVASLDVGRYCGARCRDAARALVAIRDVPLGASRALYEQRETIADELLELWRQGLGRDPADVLFAAEYARA